MMCILSYRFTLVYLRYFFYLRVKRTLVNHVKNNSGCLSHIHSPGSGCHTSNFRVRVVTRSLSGVGLSHIHYPGSGCHTSTFGVRVVTRSLSGFGSSHIHFPDPVLGSDACLLPSHPKYETTVSIKKKGCHHKNLVNKLC